MTTLTIPNVDDDLAQRLRTRAAVHGRSVEAEARGILEDALGGRQLAAAPDNLYEAIRAIVEPLGGIELEPFPHQALPEPPNFE